MPSTTFGFVSAVIFTGTKMKLLCRASLGSTTSSITRAKRLSHACRTTNADERHLRLTTPIIGDWSFLMQAQSLRASRACPPSELMKRTMGPFFSASSSSRSLPMTKSMSSALKLFPSRTRLKESERISSLERLACAVASMVPPLVG